MNKSLF